MSFLAAQQLLPRPLREEELKKVLDSSMPTSLTVHYNAGQRSAYTSSSGRVGEDGQICLRSSLSVPSEEQVGTTQEGPSMLSACICGA